jgi:bifunctional non-homologous end joining protein LigD
VVPSLRQSCQHNANCKCTWRKDSRSAWRDGHGIAAAQKRGPNRGVSGATTTGPLAGHAVDPSSSPSYLTDMLLARSLPAGFIAPCLPMTAPRPPSGPLWLHEVKHDGFRIIARKDGLRVRLYSRQGNDLTNRFPLIVEAMARLPSCTLDGEGVACDDSGVASFNLLLHRKRDDHAFLFAFDLIELDGEDLRRQSLEQRKFKLHRLLAHAAPGLVFNDWIDGSEVDAATVFEHARSLGLEGIVSKRKGSRYVSGRSPYWLKMKNPASEAARREAEEEWGR